MRVGKGQYGGRVSEIRLEPVGHLEVHINCPTNAIPSAGQYLLSCDLDDPNAFLANPLFLTEKTDQGFWAAPLLPVAWAPGGDLDLVGPLGHGFDLPRTIQRLALVALGETVARLIPLIHQKSIHHTAITLFTDLSLPKLPAAVEVYPTSLIKDALDWPDFLVFDVPVERLSEIKATLGLSEKMFLPCPSQVLVTTPMPCAGMAQCGACAVPARRGYKLACEEGPVFDIKDLKW